MAKKSEQSFADFISDQGVIGLAVGLAVGLAATATVQTIVDFFINPIVGFLLGGTNLSAMTWTVTESADRSLVIGWGAILNSAISLLATAFVVYLLVVKSGLYKLGKKK